MRAFISGHRDLTEQEFNDHYKELIDAGIANDDLFYVCDYYGADIMAQAYLKNKNYKNVIVVHMCNAPRNYVGGYPRIGGWKTDEERDAFCTEATDYDIAWSRKPGSGTEQNLLRRKEKSNGTI